LDDQRVSLRELLTGVNRYEVGQAICLRLIREALDQLGTQEGPARASAFCSIVDIIITFIEVHGDVVPVAP
jgi:hypothetical protein